MVYNWIDEKSFYPAPPSDEDVVREVHRYVMSRLPSTEPTHALAMAGATQPATERDKSWGIIEID